MTSTYTATRDTVIHGNHIAETSIHGGAFTIINPSTRKVIMAQCFPLPNENDDNGASAPNNELSTTLRVHAAVLRLAQVGTLTRGTNLDLTTDSKASVDAVKAHCTPSSTVSQMTKTPLQRNLCNIAAIMKELRTTFDITISLFWNRHEHGRPQEDDTRDEIECLANRACDRWAGLAAAEAGIIDSRHEPIRHAGWACELSLQSANTEADLKSIMERKAAAQAVSRIMSTQEGQVANAALLGTVSKEATAKALSMLNRKIEITAARALLQKSPDTMNSILIDSEHDPASAVLHKTLLNCGRFREYCPHCFNLDTQLGHIDSRSHRRHTCTSPPW